MGAVTDAFRGAMIGGAPVHRPARTHARSRCLRTRHGPTVEVRRRARGEHRRRSEVTARAARSTLRAVIDIRLLRETPDEVRAGYARLGGGIDLDPVIAQDARLRDLKNESQTMQAEQNRLSKEIGRAAPGEAREQAKAASTALKEKIEQLAGDLAAAEAKLDELLLELPNLPHPSVPVGKDDSENKVVREEGAKRAFDFAPQPHWDLGTKLGIIDFERGVKISGSRFYVLKSWGARLQRALITYMLDLHTQKHGYVEIYPPYMVRRECLVGTGNLPKFGENLYHDADEDFWWIPTAEVPVTNLYREEILDGATLPDPARRLHGLLPPRADGGRAATRAASSAATSSTRSSS